MAYLWEDGSERVGKLPMSWEDWGWGKGDSVAVMDVDDQVTHDGFNQ